MRFVMAAGLSALLICASLPASAEKISNLKIGNWKGGAYTSNRTGDFIHCAAGAGYKSGVRLSFGVTSKLHWWMQLSNPKWNFNIGDSYTIDFWVDGGNSRSAKGTTVTQRAIRIALPPRDSLFRRFRRGRLLEIRAAQKKMSFKLTTTDRLLSRLFRCAKRYRSSSSSSDDNPFD